MNVLYLGCGRKQTGEWCFKDGYINFDNIISLYNAHFSGKKFVIYSDCSYSGNCVEQALRYLKSNQIALCLHSARKKGTVISVYSSYHSHQVPYSLLTTVRAWNNDKNSGYCIIVFIQRVAENHSTWDCHNAEMICKATSLELDCLLPEHHTWQRRVDERRSVLANCSGVWKVFLVIDDPEIYYQVLTRQIEVNKYSEEIKAGAPEDVIAWLNKEYLGHTFQLSQFS